MSNTDWHTALRPSLLIQPWPWLFINCMHALLQLAAAQFYLTAAQRRGLPPDPQTVCSPITYVFAMQTRTQRAWSTPSRGTRAW